MSTTAPLPDPRSRAPAAGALIEAAGAAAQEPLQAALRAALEAGDDAAIRSALRGAAPEQARRIAHVLSMLIDSGGDGVALRLFAIPVIVVAGARAATALPGTLPEISKVVGLLEQHGAVGVTRNFGLGNALSGVAALEALSPCALWRAAGDPAAAGVADHLPPEPVVVAPGREQVHLRFLTGAGITPQHLPSFLESAANIGTWGMPLTRELTRQLAVPGVEILPLPRPPLSLVKAAYSGRCAQLEAALSLFLGNSVREFRMSAGDPQAVLSAHRMTDGMGELRLSLSSPFDDALLEGFRWPLHPQDEVAEVAVLFARALADCRITDVQAVAQVLPGQVGNGSMFVGQRYFRKLAAGPAAYFNS